MKIHEMFPYLCVSDATEAIDFYGKVFGATPVTIHLHVDDAELIRRAAELGATVEREPKDEFYGERSGCIRDPFGHRWLIGHSIEDVTPQEMQRRYNKVPEKA